MNNEEEVKNKQQELDKNSYEHIAKVQKIKRIFPLSKDQIENITAKTKYFSDFRDTDYDKIW